MQAGAASPAAPAWKVWTALWIVYLVWGSTYLAIRVMVETVPPLLGAGTRFAVAGAVMVGVLSFTRSVRPTRAQLLSALLVGILLPGANAVVTVAEQEVPSSVAALLIASVPLWVILMRRGSGERVSRAGIARGARRLRGRRAPAAARRAVRRRDGARARRASCSRP